MRYIKGGVDTYTETVSMYWSFQYFWIIFKDVNCTQIKLQFHFNLKKKKKKP